VKVLWPHLTGVQVKAVSIAGHTVRIDVQTSTAPAACPGCGTMSGRVHSRYDRHLSDTAAAGREVLVRLTVRRLFCDNPDCTKMTFAEQMPELAARYARRTTILARSLCAVALALGGRAGARLTGRLACSVSRMTLLRMVRGLPDPDRPTPRVLGVDDFALRRGHHYGTLLVDVESHRPVDVLSDRTAQTVADWLRAHSGVQIICRDRASAYAEAARDGAPDAVQVADRWHLWHNLAEAVECTLARHQDDLSAALTPQTSGNADANTHADDQVGPDDHPTPVAPATPAGPARPGDRTDRWAVRARQRHADVHALLADGVGITAICGLLELSRGTVRRFARADTVEELLTTEPDTGPACWSSSNPICTNASQPHTPTQPSCSPRSPHAATGAARASCATTCSSSAPSSVSLRHRPNHPRSAASRVGL
jgi:hypothetical protein